LLFLQLRSEWKVGPKAYPAGALLVTDLGAFLKGQRNFAVLFEPTERKSLSDFSPTRNHVLLDELDNVRNRIYVLTRTRKGTWERKELPGAPTLSTVGV